eukprot:CAMPEP_0181213240 /NCGR_PEP_ID=MMETSP1096-20121128/24795_1 /TAXON_ID=156174 ORGANISM="Chrysochromulina ericina, Strain CCMP281" /NCGR_SAMPLE_ID=MMETSP1096 /ASSEMBLY_ACC=CAM_ASM_000453 /LENGTH=46 /DNA_ID= /DNA_START= /DNA_END= /DNA_ORIENTATION=
MMQSSKPPAQWHTICRRLRVVSNMENPRKKPSAVPSKQAIVSQMQM